ncbi:MAG TPA: hypothetical protein VGV37_17495 [Aliidongia sp.]|uniref:hypothetical protein n=1 Tax=Aliidongia sp. TaxID=1914230 RepID=UPI002DDDA1F3|nr:hypothetical protein [Aliidongia sp.]HEV2676324.1 hypothetical protein [Aliidongia sp.]
MEYSTTAANWGRDPKLRSRTSQAAILAWGCTLLWQTLATEIAGPATGPSAALAVETSKLVVIATAANNVRRIIPRENLASTIYGIPVKREAETGGDRAVPAPVRAA